MVEGTAEAGPTVRPKAAAAAPATTAVLLRVFFMARGVSLWIDRQRWAVAEAIEGRPGGPRLGVSCPRTMTLLAGNLAEQWHCP